MSLWDQTFNQAWAISLISIRNILTSNLQRDDVISPIALTTDHWILADHDYCGWEQNPLQWLFISGKPGSGKSVITRAIEQRLSTMQDPNEGMGVIKDPLEPAEYARRKQTSQFMVASWYCSSRDGPSLHDQMLRSLLYQILQQDPTLFQHIQPTYRQQNDSANIWSTHRTMEALEICCNNITKRLFLIVDGLDQSNTENLKPSRLERIRCLERLRLGVKPINILFSSRSVDDIAISIPRSSAIVLNERNRPDIERIVSMGIEQISSVIGLGEPGDLYSDELNYPATSLSPRFFQTYFQRAEGQNKRELKRLGDLLTHKAKGVILWVTTTLKVLQERCDEPFIDVSELVALVGDIPHGELNNLYCHIVDGLLEKLKPERIALCRQALMWTAVGAGYSGFHLQHLLEVLAIESPGNSKRWFGFTSWILFKDHLRRLCGSLVEVVQPNGWSEFYEYHHFDEVQLIHPTVIAFLQDSSLARDLSFTLEEAEENVVKKAKKYTAISLPGDPTGEDPLPFSMKMTNKDKINVLLSYLEAKPLLPYIMENISDVKPLNSSLSHALMAA
ncbi:hypothetical protein BGZ57DRAFT_479575 [Hyaloscypha finlandica]|nr:hypothetical protein BGZ57DRAFT_479575 [Hyaloscypha finlandica]